MANTTESSFIPRRTTGRTRAVRRTRRIYVFAYISYVFFFATLIGVGGVFLYETQIEKDLKNQKSQLAVERQRFNQSDIARVREFERRIESASRKLNTHAAATIVFSALESVITKSVQVDKFMYTRVNENEVKLEFSGITKTFNAILFQREVMENNTLLRNALYSEITYNDPSSIADDQPTELIGLNSEEVTVGFLVSTGVPASEILYTPQNVTGTVPEVDVSNGNTEENTDESEALESNEGI